ncbi:ferredoxin [Streptomyces sp. NPDC052309]|uniref:ferredoxin n=1 Tax=Streptomyces sp. NPDC052309 TaxID=3155421 RepID=UPI003434A10D
MKIIIDRTKCTGLGICESIAPELFEIDENGELIVHNDTVPDGTLDVVEQAVRGCPTEALRLEP